MILMQNFSFAIFIFYFRGDDLIFKLVSLDLVLTRACVYSTTTQNHLVSGS